MHRPHARTGPWWVAFPSLLGAGAALVLPTGASGTTTAGATLLAVGALALLAGHTWGLFVVIPAHLALLGRVWPGLVHVGPAAAGPGGELGAGAIAVVLVTALPALTLGAILLPRLVGTLLPHKSPRTQGFCVTGALLLMFALLVLPAL